MTSTYIADIFPVIQESIPILYAYGIKTVCDDFSAIGGKTAYRLKNKFGGDWIWCNGQIIGDKQIGENDLRKFLKELWEKDDGFLDIQNITTNNLWKPLPWEQGDFAARALYSRYQTDIKQILDKKRQIFGKIRIDRDYLLRGWAVNEKPAISISVSSNIEHLQNLSEYATTISDTQELIGMMVIVSSKGFKGEICEITGPISEQRDWLLKKSMDEETRSLIYKAPEDELTVKIDTRRNKYIYISSMLRPIVRMGDLSRFGCSPRQVSRALRLDPEYRNSLVQEIAVIGKNHKIITDNFDTNNSLNTFLTASDIGFVPELEVGNSFKHCPPQRIFQSLQSHGLYKRSPLFPDKNHAIKIGIINSSPQSSNSELIKFLNNLKTAMDKLGFGIESVKVDGQSQQRIEKLTRAYLEDAVNRLEPCKPDILLVLFPGEAGQEQLEEDNDESMYHSLKSHSIRLGIPSQVVYEDTFSEDFALENIVLGILAKTRNVPFILAKPLPYADIVVGIDIARRAKKKLAGSVNATAIARIYFNDGQFLRYTIHDAPIDGETIPPQVLRALFPMKEFHEKRVIVHRDGLFRGSEKQALLSWAKELKSEFQLVEVIKSGAPRLYQKGEKIDKPPKGTAFKLSPTEAILVSSPPPFKDSTPRPLHIRTEGEFPIEKALHSVLSLTLLHYGSVREPRLPVTIHYSDKIAELSLLGIKPKDLEGDVPFWL